MSITCADRISELPRPIQHQILSLISQKDAARICVLSKSWRQHWFTRPNVDFSQISESDVNKTLQRYLDQNLSIHEFRLHVPEHDRRWWAKLLRKWIPVLKILNFYLFNEEIWCHYKFGIPSSVFEVESLQKLYLEICTLNQVRVVNVLFKHLKTLHLVKVDIPYVETLKKIISSCPLIESVTFDCCRGINTTIKLDDKLRNLKHFESTTSNYYGRPPSIEIDLPSSVIQKIKISCCPVLFRNNEYQRNLKSLSLTRVRLSNEMFDLFSWNNMPSLEFLELVSCYGYKEFHLSSRSIKHLVLHKENRKKKPPVISATIDTPSLVYFDYSSFYLPPIFSVSTTCEWKSNVKLRIINKSSWFEKLHQLLKALSGSEISLFLYNVPPGYRKTEVDVLLQDNKQPVVVDHLEIWSPYHSTPSRSDFMNQLFGICHPRALVGDEKTDDFLSKFVVIDTGIRKGTALGNKIWRM